MTNRFTTNFSTYDVIKANLQKERHVIAKILWRTNGDFMRGFAAKDVELKVPESKLQSSEMKP